MANWNQPALADTYTDFLDRLKQRDEDAARMFDVGSPTNVPTDAIKYSSANRRFEKWNGVSWDELQSAYNISADRLGGQDAANYARLDLANTFDGNITIANVQPRLTLNRNSGSINASIGLELGGVERGRILMQNDNTLQISSRDGLAAPVNILKLTQTVDDIQINDKTIVIETSEPTLGKTLIDVTGTTAFDGLTIRGPAPAIFMYEDDAVDGNWSIRGANAGDLIFIDTTDAGTFGNTYMQIDRSRNMLELPFSQEMCLRVRRNDALPNLTTNDSNALTLGSDTGINLAFDYEKIQCRNNGVASTLKLNPYGGDVEINGEVLPFTKAFESTQQTWTTSGLVTVTHGLGVRPKLYMAYFVWIGAEGGYAIGDEVPFTTFNATVDTQNNQLTRAGATVYVDNDTQVKVRIGPSPFIAQQDTGGVYGPSTTNTRIIVRAWA